MNELKKTGEKRNVWIIVLTIVCLIISVKALFFNLIYKKSNLVWSVQVSIIFLFVAQFVWHYGEWHRLIENFKSDFYFEKILKKWGLLKWWFFGKGAIKRMFGLIFFLIFLFSLGIHEADVGINLDAAVLYVICLLFLILFIIFNLAFSNSKG